MADVEGTTERRGAGHAAASAARGLLGLVGSIVRFVTGAFAAILVLQIALLLLGANPFNWVSVVVAAAANALTLGLSSLFVPASPTAQVVVAYGVPAIAWLIIGAVLVAILRALARPRSGLR